MGGRGLVLQLCLTLPACLHSLLSARRFTPRFPLKAYPFKTYPLLLVLVLLTKN